MLDRIVTFEKKRLRNCDLRLTEYVSTDNMLSDFGGVRVANRISKTGTSTSFIKGDILVSNIRPYLNKIWYATFDGGCSPDVFVYRAKKNIVTSPFLYNILANKAFITYVMNGAKGVKMPRGDKEQMMKYPCSIPSLQEQDKISSLLKFIDERIATQRRLIEDLEKLKSSLAQQLFKLSAPTIRLGELASVTNGNADVQDATNNYEAGLYPFFDRSEQIKYLNNFYLDKVAIIYAGEGQDFFPRYFEGKFALHQRCYAIYDFDKRTNPRYCYHYMRQLNRYFQKIAVGSTVASLRMDSFLNAPIKIPSISTQTHIVNVLDSVEHKTIVARQLLSNFILERKYLLLKLFI